MSRRTEYEEDDARSTDGSDSEGSLKDFILHSEDEEEEEQEEKEVDASTLANELVEEFPFDKSLLEEQNTSGPRRSRRTRQAPTRYVDDRYAKLMYDDVDMDKLSESDDDASPVNDQSEDEDYDEDADSSSDEDDEDDDEEETLTSNPPVVVKISKKRTATRVAREPVAKRSK